MIKQQEHQPQHQILGNWFLISSLLNQSASKSQSASPFFPLKNHQHLPPLKERSTSIDIYWLAPKSFDLINMLYQSIRSFNLPPPQLQQCLLECEEGYENPPGMVDLRNQQLIATG